MKPLKIRKMPKYIEKEIAKVKKAFNNILGEL